MRNDIVLEKIAAHVREGLEFRIKSFTEIADAADIRAAKLAAKADAILAESKVEAHFAAQNREAAARARAAKEAKP